MIEVLKIRNPGVHYRASWIELLFDLAFVVALASTTHTLVGMSMPAGLMQFIVTFLLLVWVWAGFTIFVSVFEGAEKWHFAAVTQIGLVLLLATHHDLYGDDYFNFVVIYSLLRAVSVGMYLYVWRNLVEARVFAKVQVAGIIVTLIPMWIGLWSDDAVVREQLFLLAALLQMFIPLLAFFLDKNIVFNAEHIPERMGLLVCLTLGEAFLAIAHVSEEVSSLTPIALMYGLLCVLTIYGLWRMYFGMLSNIQFHGHQRRAVFWMLLHLPLILCLLGLATGLERNLHFIRHGDLYASDRLLISWGGAIVTVALLGVFWASDVSHGIRSIVWRAVAVLSGVGVIAAPFIGFPLSPEAGLWLIATLGILIMAINPSLRPWGYS